MLQKKSSSQTALARKSKWRHPAMLQNLYKMEISPTALKLQNPRYGFFHCPSWLLFFDILTEQYRLYILLGSPSCQPGQTQAESYSSLCAFPSTSPGPHMHRALSLLNKYTYFPNRYSSGWGWKTHASNLPWIKLQIWPYPRPDETESLGSSTQESAFLISFPGGSWCMVKFDSCCSLILSLCPEGQG